MTTTITFIIIAIIFAIGVSTVNPNKMFGLFETKNKVTNRHKEAIQKIVDFWVDKSFNEKYNQDNGDYSYSGLLGFQMMNQLSMEAQKNVTDEKIVFFKERLAENLENEIKRVGFIYGCDVDYEPCEFLRDACEYAGINTECLPIKTWARIDREVNVFVKYQDNGEIVEL